MKNFFIQISQLIPDFQLREEQILLSEAINQAIEKSEVLIAEAGTGIGKTLAYLIPIAKSGKKALLSTASKNLQEQIINKDIPVLERLLQREINASVLKGRANYFCHYHYFRHVQSQEALNNAEAEERYQIERFLRRTSDGDLAELRGVSENAILRPFLSSTTENCLNSQCPQIANCFVKKAKERAQKADLIIVNHHLLALDLNLEDFAILPQAETVIIDEAHRFPEIFGQSLGTEISKRALQLFLNEVEDNFSSDLLVNSLKNKVKALISWADYLKPQIIEEEQLRLQDEFWSLLRELKNELQEILREENWQDLFAYFCESDLLADSEEEEQQALFRNFLKRCFNLFAKIENSLQITNSVAQWLEIKENNFILSTAPTDSSVFEKALSKANSWLFLSATLSVNNEFSYFAQKLGISAYQSLLLGSPFNYKKQMLRYELPNLPEPNNPNYHPEMIKALLPVLKITAGRAFLLFTSVKAIQECKKLLENQGFNILAQGDLGKNELLERFRNEENSLLLASYSFWEGIDVRGRELVCVLIDKIPFAVPSHPVIKKIYQQIEENGGNSFMSEALPNAIITLKQGIGRLIRDVSDYGILIIADPRLTQKFYGRKILNSIPVATVTSDIERVKRFFAYHENNLVKE